MSDSNNSINQDEEEIKDYLQSSENPPEHRLRFSIDIHSIKE